MYDAKISTELIQIINSYLKNRRFVVTHGDGESSSREVMAGVPQGSVLGPLVFLIFINDIPNFKDHSVALFADDTAIMASSGSCKILMDKIAEHFELINEFFHKWKIKVNETKTNLLIIRHKNYKNKKIETIKLTLKDQIITEQKYVKYLGVLIDRKLNFD